MSPAFLYYGLLLFPTLIVSLYRAFPSLIESLFSSYTAYSKIFINHIENMVLMLCITF